MIDARLHLACSHQELQLRIAQGSRARAQFAIGGGILGTFPTGTVREFTVTNDLIVIKRTTNATQPALLNLHISADDRTRHVDIAVDVKGPAAESTLETLDAEGVSLLTRILNHDETLAAPVVR